MSMVAKLVSIASLGSVVLGISLAPAYALRMPEGTVSQVTGQQGVSAYAGDDRTAEATETSILSANEIRHIKWCAARYTFGYDAVTDTYAGANNARMQCHSPR